MDAARGGKLRIAGEPNQRGENSIRDRVSSGSASRSSGTGPTGGNPASPATETSSIPEYSSEQKQQAAISRQGTKSCDGNFVLVDGSKSKGFDCAGNNRGWVCGKVKGGGNDTIGCFKP